ncbi:helix-turn-helix domain-containing protein [Lactococcus formosensis]|uniref:helix-turn-helix domain-containing protein n=1 Tax=Lactococcus formosensis TaxID=1281486 RepID=UPI0039F6A9AB
MKREISMIIDVNLLAERIKLNRKNLGLSQKKFSVLIGTTQVTVLRYEKGERQPSEEILEKCLSFLG